MPRVPRPRPAALAPCLLVLALALSAPPSRAQHVTDLYVHDAQGQLAVVDVDNGQVTLIGDMGVVMTDIAFAQDGRLFGLDFVTFYEIDPNDATIAAIGPHGIPNGNALVFAADGTLYAMGAQSNQLYELDPTSGDATALGNVGVFSAGDLAFHGGELYISSTADTLVRIDLGPPASGTGVGSIGFAQVYGLATSEDGVLYGVTGTEIIEVDPATGAGTFLSNYSGQGVDVAYGSSFLGESFQACPLAPVPDCRAAAKAKLTFKGKRPGREKLALSLAKLEESSQADFGDPVAGTTRYEVCLYDAADALAGGLGVARAGDACGRKGKPCWKAKGEKGWRYKNPNATPSGVKAMSLVSGPPGKGKLKVKAANSAKKLQRALPAGIGPALAGATSVTVQLRASDGQCYEATLTTIKKAESTLFKGKAP